MTHYPRETCSYCNLGICEEVYEPHWILQCHCHEDAIKSLEWRWDNSPLANKSFQLSENEATVTFHPAISWGTAIVRGNTELKSDLHYWEIKAVSPLYGTDIMVGVGHKSVDLEQYRQKFRSALGVSSNTWGLSYRGDLMHAGKSTTLEGCSFRRGSIIGVLLDLWNGSIRFYVNGILAQDAFFNGLPRVSYYPMVSSTALRSGFRLIRACSYPMTLQLLACRAFYHNFHNSDVAASLQDQCLPPYLKSYFSTTLPWSLYMRKPPTNITSQSGLDASPNDTVEEVKFEHTQTPYSEISTSWRALQEIRTEYARKPCLNRPCRNISYVKFGDRLDDPFLWTDFGTDYPLAVRERSERYPVDVNDIDYEDDVLDEDEEEDSDFDMVLNPALLSPNQINLLKDPDNLSPSIQVIPTLRPDDYLNQKRRYESAMCANDVLDKLHDMNRKQSKIETSNDSEESVISLIETLRYEHPLWGEFQEWNANQSILESFMPH